eukprot:1240251-Prymnesium_polylepis.4
MSAPLIAPLDLTIAVWTPKHAMARPMTAEGTAKTKAVVSPQSWQRASSLSKYLDSEGASHSSHSGPW